jgi:hypothetical protein
MEAYFIRGRPGWAGLKKMRVYELGFAPESGLACGVGAGFLAVGLDTPMLIST